MMPGAPSINFELLRIETLWSRLAFKIHDDLKIGSGNYGSPPIIVALILGELSNSLVDRRAAATGRIKANGPP